MQVAKRKTRRLLLSLPEELLLSIVEHLDDEDLYHFAELCRTLHRLALHIFFNRHCPAVYAGELILENPVPFLLPALRAALFVKDIRSITIFFSPDVQSFFAQARALTALLNRLPYNDALTIYIGSVMETLRDPDVDIDPEELASTLQHLMDTALGKGCNKLYIATNPLVRSPDFGSVQKKRSNTLSGFVKQIGHVFAGKNLRPSSRTNKNDPPSLSENGVTKRSLITSTDLLLESFFSNWTLSVFNHGDLTEVYFLARLFKEKALQKFLPKLHIPRLATFGLTGRKTDLSLDVFARFLDRHLKTLNVLIFKIDQGYINPHGDGDLPLLYLNLPQLQKISLSSHYLPWFISRATASFTSNYLPKLKAVTVLVSEDAPKAPNLDKAFETIANLCRMSKKTADTFCLNQLSINTKTVYASRFLRWLDAYSKHHSDTPIDNSTSSPVTFPLIRQISLEVNGMKTNHEEHLYKTLPGFLALFPDLHELLLIQVSAGRGRKQGGEYWRGVRERCPKLRGVIFNGDPISMKDLMKDVLET